MANIYKFIGQFLLMVLFAFIIGVLLVPLYEFYLENTESKEPSLSLEVD